MNSQQKSSISKLRQKGMGYKAISETLGVSLNTVKSYCQRHNLQRQTTNPGSFVRLCMECGKEIPQNPHRKAKKFCCNQCRMAWWKAHSDEIHRKSQQLFVCAVCGKEFSAYGSAGRKYCSRNCYGKAKEVSHAK